MTCGTLDARGWARLFGRLARGAGLRVDDPQAVRAAWKRFQPHHPTRRLDVHRGTDGWHRVRFLERNSTAQGRWERLFSQLKRIGDRVEVGASRHGTQVAVWRYRAMHPGVHVKMDHVPGGTSVTRVPAPRPGPTKTARLLAIPDGGRLRVPLADHMRWRSLCCKLNREHPGSRWTVGKKGASGEYTHVHRTASKPQKRARSGRGS